MSSFTPVASTLGGLLIGVAAAAMFYFNGRITGISGILDGAIIPRAGETAWRWVFLAGMLVGGSIWIAVSDATFVAPNRSTAAIIVAGLLVGFGTKMSNGCTSGHGVCGNARLSPRSIVATLTFIGVGAAVVAGINAMGGAL